MPRKTSAEEPAATAAQRRLDFDSEAAAAPSTASTSSARSPSTTRKRDNNQATIATSPAKKTRLTVPAVTPEEQAKRDQDALAISTYVPKYIHANVGYKTKSTAPLSPSIVKVYKWIAEHCDIPVDLEQRRAFGPLSGLSYEERVIQQYDLGQLTLKREYDEEEDKEEDDDIDSSPNSTKLVICTCCAEVGHKRNDCPALV